MLNLGRYLIALPALRCLAIQNLGVTSLEWIRSNSIGQRPPQGPAGPVHSLDLDDNANLQLDAEGAAAVINMTGLKKLSMQKSAAHSRGSVADGMAGQAGAAQSGAVWSAESVRSIAWLMTARPALQMCF